MERIFGGHDYSRMETDWPADAEITFANWEPDRNQLMLTVTSTTFDDVPEASLLPEWTPTITLYMDETAQLLNIVHREQTEND